MDNNVGDYSFLQPCAWSDQSSPEFMSSVQDYGVISGKVDLIEAFFDSSLEFHGAAATRRQLLAEATTDSMSSASAAEISLCQLAAPWINNISPAALEPTQNYQDKYLPGREEEGGAGAVTAVVLSSCDNAPTNSYSRSASSGESENRDSCGSQLKRRARHPQYYTSNYLQHQDELVSQCSSNPPLRRKEQEHNKLRRERYDLDLFGNIPSLCDSTAAAEGGFRIVFGNTSRLTNKKPRHHHRPILSGDSSGCEPDMEAVAQVKEMIYRAAALRPVTFGGAAAEGAAEKPRRRNVRISSDPQTVAARHRRERISERLRVLQRLVPGGGRMDTASMLDEAASYLRFLKSQVAALEALAPPTGNTSTTTTCAAAATSASSSQLTPQYSDSQFLPFRPMQNFPLLRTRASLQALPCCDHVAPAPAGAPLP